MKIANKIIIGVTLCLVVAMAVIGFLIGSYSVSVIEGKVVSYLQSSNRARAEHIRTFLQSQKEESEILSSASVYRDFLNNPEDASIKEKIRKRFERTLIDDPHLLEMYILDKNGKVIASSDREEEGEDRSDDTYFTEGNKKTFIKDFYLYGEYNTIVYAVSSPVFNDDKILLGVSVLIFSPDNFYEIVKSENGLGSTEENFLINKDKFFLTPSIFLGKNVILKQKVETENAEACFQKDEIDYVTKNGYSELEHSHRAVYDSAQDYRGVNIIGTHAYIPETNWCLITKIDKSVVVKDITNITIINATILSVVFIVLMVLIYILINRLSLGLKKLGSEVAAVESGDFDVKINSGGNDEIGILSKAFIKMIAAVKQSRAEVDRKVEEQTREIVEKQESLETQQKSILNILEDIEEEKAKTSALLEGIGEGVVATDVNTSIIYMNKAAEDLIGWKIEEVLGKRLYDFLKVLDEKGKEIPEEKRPFSIALKIGKPVISSIQNSYYYTRRNGEKFPVSISVTPAMLNDKLLGAINVFRDITHEKEIDKAKTEFVSLASHQLRTPLSAINWYTEMLLAGDAGKILPEQKQYLEEVYRSNKRMVDLVNSLLNVSRIDLGTFAITPELVDLAEVSKSVLVELTPMIKTKNMNIEENYAKNLKKINVDSKLTRIIFQNLLSNAVKYTPENGKVSVSIEKQNENVLIKVADTGYGIPKKDQARIFEKLFRADNIREKETDGTGLGLYIVKSILEQSGGKIWFESNDDQSKNPGTTFFVTIPFFGMKAKEGTKDLG